MSMTVMTPTGEIEVPIRGGGGKSRLIKFGFNTSRNR